MELNWDEINLIIKEKSSKSSYMVKPEEMEPENLAVIQFLINEVYRFPDKQKTVTDSGAQLRKYLTGKYNELDGESIERLVHRFCFLNR